MAWFWTIIQLLIRLLASFWSCGMKMLHGIWYKLEDWIKRYLIQTYHRLSQEYFKSYRIAFRVALWFDFEQLSSYLFISRCHFRAAISKCYMEFDKKKLEDWINRYLIQTYHRLSQEYFKSYRIAFRVALWLDFEQLSSYLFVYRRYFRAAISKCYMEFDTKLEDWIKRYLIQTYHRLSQEYFKSYRIAFRVALWLDFEQLSSYLFIYRRIFGVAVWKGYMEFDTNWRIESRDILFKLTTGYLKSISSHIE